MHSSRMRTARALPYEGGLFPGVSLTEPPLDRDPPYRDLPDRDPKTETPWSYDLWYMLGQRPPCEQND